MRKTSNAVAFYTGGVHNLIEAAVSEQGTLFKRYQNKTRYGYRWTAWRAEGKQSATNPPETLTAGFSTLYRQLPTSYRYRNVRLPKEA